MAKELGREYFAGFSPAAERALLGYGWPGNIRELRNVVERAVYRVEHEYSTIEALEFDPFASPYRPKAMASQLSTTAIEPAAATAAEPVSNIPDAAPQMPMVFQDAVTEFETRLIRQALEDGRYNQRKADRKSTRLNSSH